MTKSKAGRPPVGPTVHIKIPPELLGHLDRVARDWNVTRSEAARRLLILSLGTTMAGLRAARPE